MYWKHHPLSFVSGPSYTRKQSYISACRSPAGFIRGARGRTGGYAAVSRWLKLEETKCGQGWESEKIREEVNPAPHCESSRFQIVALTCCSISNEFTDLYEICRYYSSFKSSDRVISRDSEAFSARLPSLEIPYLIDISRRYENSF